MRETHLADLCRAGRRQVDDIGDQLEHLTHVGPGGGQGDLEILVDLFGLRSDVALADGLAGGVEGDLSRDVDLLSRALRANSRSASRASAD